MRKEPRIRPERSYRQREQQGDGSELRRGLSLQQARKRKDLTNEELQEQIEQLEASLKPLDGALRQVKENFESLAGRIARTVNRLTNRIEEVNDCVKALESDLNGRIDSVNQQGDGSESRPDLACSKPERQSIEGPKAQTISEKEGMGRAGGPPRLS